MNRSKGIVLFHTAFIGDVVLLLPLAQELRASIPDVRIAAVTIPQTAPLLANHPAIDEVLQFDKKGRDAGLSGLLRFSRRLRACRFDCALIPHRSLRSALVCALARIPERIGFSTSMGRFLFTRRIPYDRRSHETARNLSLGTPVGVQTDGGVLPSLYPGGRDVARVDHLLQEWRGRESSFGDLIALAPGSVWNTKRWPSERFSALARMLRAARFGVVLVGGREDKELSAGIASEAGGEGILNAAGELSLLQSAELIRRCRVAVSNDSAPAHLAVAMRVPVVSIFGATVPAFGFAPGGPFDAVVETEGLPCRPCGIHGGRSCPVGTFECMLAIGPEQVHSKILEIIRRQER